MATATGAQLAAAAARAEPPVMAMTPVSKDTTDALFHFIRSLSARFPEPCSLTEANPFIMNSKNL